MKRSSSALFSLLLFSAISLLSVTAFAETPFRAVASIKPIHSILMGLMKGAQEPELLVEKGVPYGYELSEQQKQHISEADLIVWAGPELEKFLIDPAQKIKADAILITLLDNPELKILPSRWNEAERDPFFWLDSRNMLILINDLTRILMMENPVHAHLYKANRDILFARIAEMDRRLEYGYRGMKAGVGIAYYDTLQYFEQAYALKITGVVAQSPKQKIDAEKLLTEKANLSQGYYACLLTEAGMDMPELDILTQGVEINTSELDSFGSQFKPGADLYLQLMEYNTSEIKKCLQTGIESDAEVEEEMPVKSASIGGKFMLVDHQGNMLTERDLLGKYQLMYFGYTFCPDVCPSSLQVISATLEMLGEKADKLQPYFVTVDPERDTQEIMAGYVKYFDKRLIGLTGSRAMTDRVIRQYNLVVEKVMEEGADPDDYILDHTASVFLIAPDGRFITKFAHGITPQQMVEKINEYVP